MVDSFKQVLNFSEQIYKAIADGLMVKHLMWTCLTVMNHSVKGNQCVVSLVVKLIHSELPITLFFQSLRRSPLSVMSRS